MSLERFLFPLMIVLGAWAGARAEPPEHVWSRYFGDDVAVQAGAVATDASGEVVLVGSFSGTVDFGGGALTSAGRSDVFIAKFDAAGTHLWSMNFGDNDYDYGLNATTDAWGNVIVAGIFWSTIDFGGGALASAGKHDFFVAKFNAAGAHLWSRSFGNPDNQFGLHAGTVVDGQGNVIFAGAFQGTLDFGGGGLASAGITDVFVAKFDPTGNHLWSKRFGDASGQWANAAAVDRWGSVIVTGSFEGTVDFGGGVLASQGYTDAFVAKFDAAGNHLWSRRFGGAEYDIALNAAIDGSGDVIAAGSFGDIVDFGGGAFTSAGDLDIFVVKLNAAGNHVWSRRFGGISDDWVYGAAVDPYGNVDITGYFRWTLDFGGETLGDLDPYYDIYVAKLDPDGNHVWSQRYGGDYDQYAYAAAAHPTGDIIVAGNFSVWGTVDFGGGEFVAAGNDIFMARLTDGTSTGVTGTRYVTALLQNTPNPFNPTTTIRYSLDESMRVTISVFDVRGRLVQKLLDGVRGEGGHEVQWNGTNRSGVPVGSGVYFCRMTAGSRVHTMRMVLLK